jgi:CHAT domain-containing protein
LSEVLLEPLAASIRASSRLIIVPYGVAHALPFHALLLDGEPIGASRTITYLPSASVLQFLQDEAHSPDDRILVVGNPTGDLTAAATEAAYVASLYNAQPLIGDDATEEAVRQRISDAELLHFATHGNLSATSPLASSLSLAGGDELTVYELMGLRLKARLVVLSACDTGRGEATGGDDVLGLARGLLAAGARAAVVSLWPVDDVATSLFMGEFYRSLRGGQSPAAALRAAQNSLRTLTPDGVSRELDALKRGLILAQAGSATDVADHRGPATGDYSHPHFWAPFVFIGV